MAVSDDGVGFDETAVIEGQGVANMRSRAEAIEGDAHAALEPGPRDGDRGRAPPGVGEGSVRGGARDADHRVARDDRGERRLVQVLRSRRALRDHDVADVGRRVDDSNLDLLVEVRARTPRGRRGDPRPRASGRAGSCTSPVAAPGALSGSRSKACKRPCDARRPCSRARRPAATPPDRGRAPMPPAVHRRARAA